MRHFLLLALIAAAAPARDWRSLDGTRTLQADFGGLKENQVLLKPAKGQTMVLPLAALSKEDQEFARLAQVSLNGAQVLGPQTLEVQSVVEGGAIARLGSQVPPGKGPWVFTGEVFFLLQPGAKLERGDRLEARPLFYAGNRTFQPLEGDASVIRAFALELEEAVNADLRIRMAAGGDPARLAPPVAEPLIELVTSRGLALPLGKGLFITETNLLKDAATVVLHEDGKDLPVKILKQDDALGLALISCAHEMEPTRLLPREPAQVGQNIFALSIPLTSTRKSLAPPVLTRGIVSKAGSGSTFQHDASITEDALGGYLLSERWEVLGVFFRSASRVEGRRSSRSSSESAPEAVPSLLDCLHSQSLEKLFVEAGKDKSGRMPGVPSLKSGSLGRDAAEVIGLLRKSTGFIVATREVRHDPPAKKAAASPAAGAGPTAGGSTQFSLSGSGIRHNSRCRYFNAAKSCQAGEGKACKLCGG